MPRSKIPRVPSTAGVACDRREASGPFDVIGDVHGCAAELVALLERLGYRRPSARAPFRHPAGRRAVFVGDLVDRGPHIVRATRIVMRMSEAGSALCVPGNHEVNLLDAVRRRTRAASPGTLRTMRQIEALPKAGRRRFLTQLERFVRGLSSHLVLDGGRLVVSHAGIPSEHLGRDTETARRVAIFGQTTGGTDRFGLPVRVNWAAGYRGEALVVYGHTPVGAPEWIGNTVNIDTGCVYGGRLTALRYPERTLVSVPARRVHYRPRRALPSGIGLRASTRVQPDERI